MHNTEEEYCFIKGFTDLYGSANTPETKKEDIESLGKTLGDLSLGKEKARPQGGRVINIEKQKLFCKASAKVLFTMSIYIDSLDKDLICEFTTVKEKWD